MFCPAPPSFSFSFSFSSWLSPCDLRYGNHVWYEGVVRDQSRSRSVLALRLGRFELEIRSRFVMGQTRLDSNRQGLSCGLSALSNLAVSGAD